MSDHTGAVTWLKTLGLLLLAVTVGGHEHASPPKEPSSAGTPGFASSATQYMDLGLGYVESVVGIQAMKTCGEVRLNGNQPWL